MISKTRSEVTHEKEKNKLKKKENEVTSVSRRRRMSYVIGSILLIFTISSSSVLSSVLAFPADPLPSLETAQQATTETSSSILRSSSPPSPLSRLSSPSSTPSTPLSPLTPQEEQLLQQTRLQNVIATINQSLAQGQKQIGGIVFTPRCMGRT